MCRGSSCLMLQCGKGITVAMCQVAAAKAKEKEKEKENEVLAKRKTLMSSVSMRFGSTSSKGRS
jgi:hypothetical protein